MEEESLLNPTPSSVLRTGQSGSLNVLTIEPSMIALCHKLYKEPSQPPKQFSSGESLTSQTMSVCFACQRLSQPLTGNGIIQPRSPVYAIRLYIICYHGDLGYRFKPVLTTFYWLAQFWRIQQSHLCVCESQCDPDLLSQALSLAIFLEIVRHDESECEAHRPLLGFYSLASRNSTLLTYHLASLSHIVGTQLAL